MRVDERIFDSLVSPYDVRDYQLRKPDTAREFPETFELDAVTVKDQGNTGSCVAHALSSVVEYHNARQENNKETFSTEFIYGYRPQGYYVGSGMYIREALKTINKLGDCYTFDCPGNHEYDKAMKNINEQLDNLTDKAYPHRITQYVRLNNVDDIKSALMDYGYVVVSMKWHANYKLKNGVYTYPENDSTRGNHCVIIYGWNKDGWLVHNSWGKYWGKQGKFIVPFTFEWNEAWAVIDTIDNDDKDIKKPNKFIQFFSKVINWVNNLLRSLKKYTPQK